MSEAKAVSGTILANKAIASAWEAWAKMKPLVVSAMIASSIVAAGFALAESIVGAPLHEFSPKSAALEFAQAFLNAVIATPVAIAMHRLILRGEATPGIISFRQPYHWLFLAWVSVFLLAQNALTVLPQSAAGYALAAVVGLGVGILWLRSALLFPAIAVQEQSAWRTQLQKSWRQMNGNFWLFIRAMLLAIIPLIALLFVYLAALVIPILLIAHLPFAKVIEKVFSAAAAGAIAPAGVMIAAAIASWLYADIRARPVG